MDNIQHFANPNTGLVAELNKLLNSTDDYNTAEETKPGLCRSLCSVKYSSNEDTSVAERFHSS